MTDEQPTFEGTTVSIGGRSFAVEYPVMDAFRLGDRIIVLYDPDAYTLNYGQFPNIEAFDLRGRKLWTAELPTTITGDCYWQIASMRPLVADAFQSYTCTIDPTTGRITKKVFYK